MAIITPRRDEFFTRDGVPTQRFITWIEALTIQTNTSTTEIINTNVRETYPWPLASEATNSVQNLYQSSNEPSFEKLTAITVTSSYTAQPNDFINATLGVTITFPQYPDEGAVFVVRNGDGSSIKLDGNGKSLNGSTTGTLSRKGTAIEFYYFIDSDEWLAK